MPPRLCKWEFMPEKGRDPRDLAALDRAVLPGKVGISKNMATW